MAEELLIDVSDFESRVALVQDGAVQEVHLARSAGYSATGNIYLGKVVRIMPGMQAAFVEIGLERPGYLHAGDIEQPLVITGNSGAETTPAIRDLLHDGQELLVQVERDPIGTKGARLSTHLALASKFLVLLPKTEQVRLSQRISDAAERERLFKILGPLADQHAVGLIGRTLSDGAERSDLAADCEHLLQLWQRVERAMTGAKAPLQVFQELPIQTRLVRDLAGAQTAGILVNDPDIYQRLRAYLDVSGPNYVDKLRLDNGAKALFERHNIEQEILSAMDPHVRLRSGGTLVIEQTEAMISIDVNTAGFLGSKNPAETALQTNLEAAAAIPRQLRLRNLGGIIVIDFIDMTDSAHQQAVLAKLTETLSNDPAKTRVEGFSFLGLVQLSRKRTRQSLAQMMCAPCEHCNGAGIVKTAESTCMEIFRAISAETAAAAHPQGVARGYYALTASAEVVDRMLDEEARLYQTLTSTLSHEVRLQVDTAYRSDQFDLAFVARRS